MSEKKVYEGHLRNALITARYDHRVKRDTKMKQYMFDNGLIEEDPIDYYEPANRNYARCRITEKGKMELRRLRAKARHFENTTISTPDSSEYDLVDRTYQLRHGVNHG